MPGSTLSLLPRPMTGADERAPPIADYELIGDCRTAALVSRDGSIDWLCLPSFPGPSVFARLLDPREAAFSLRLRDRFTVSRPYVEETAVLETAFTTDAGVVRVFSCLPVIDGRDGLQPMREVLRVVEEVSGTVKLAISIEPRPNHGRSEPRLERRGRLGWFCCGGHEALHVGSEAELHRYGDRLLLKLCGVSSSSWSVAFIADEEQSTVVVAWA